jgi:hypothetical protein
MLKLQAWLKLTYMKTFSTLQLMGKAKHSVTQQTAACAATQHQCTFSETELNTDGHNLNKQSQHHHQHQQSRSNKQHEPTRHHESAGHHW